MPFILEEEPKESSRYVLEDEPTQIPRTIPGRFLRGIKSFVTDPKRVGRLTTEAAGAFAGGTIGSAVPIYGTIVGGSLGYAFGDKLADIIWGERLPPEQARQPIPQLKQTGKDILSGLKYEAMGKGMDIAGKGLYAAERGVNALAREGISPTIGKELNKMGETLAAKKLASTASKTPEVTAQIEQNLAKSEALEKDIPGLKFNLGQRGQDPNLLSLSRQQSQAPGMGTELSAQSTMAQNEAISEYIKQNIRGGGTVDDFLMSIQKEKGRITGQTSLTGKAAETEAMRLGGRGEQEVGGTLLSKAQTLRRESSKTAERLYNQIPEQLKIDSTPLWNKVNDLFGNFNALTQRLGATPTGPMSRIKKAMTPEAPGQSGLVDISGRPITPKPVEPPKNLTVGQLKDFRSQVGTAQRSAIASGDYELSYKLGQLKEAVNDSFAKSAKEATGEGIETLKTATSYYRDIHVPTYRMGATGKVLSVKPTGEQRILDSSIGGEYFKSGKGAVEAADSFKTTFRNDAEAQSLIRDYAAQSLLKDARNPVTGELESKRVMSWLYSHNTALEKFGLKDEFGSLQKALNVVDKAKGMEAQFNKSSLEKALNVDPERAIEELLMKGTSRIQSIARLRELKDLARKDTTGAATQGLKATIGDYFQRETAITARDIAGNKLESLAKMDRFIKEYRPALEQSGLYTQSEMKAFDNIHDTLKIIAQQQRPHPGFVGSATYELISRFVASGTSVALGHIGLYGAARGAFDWAEEHVIGARVNEAISKAVFHPEYADAISGLAKNIEKMPPQKAVEIFNRRMEVLGMTVMLPKQQPEQTP